MEKFIFGPVPSRRLGISLGVDIVPYKTCTLDCIYCECGKTTDLTVERKSFIDPEIVLKQLYQAVNSDKHLDHITFSGSGEPSLNKDLGFFIDKIKSVTDVPVAVITNGTLLFREEVRRELRKADLVLPSLDVATSESFRRLNRPHPGLDLEKVMAGLIEFRKVYSGKIWLEVFIAGNINDNEQDLTGLYKQIRMIRPDKVQLNSLDRPPAYEGVQPAAIEVLEDIVKQWKDLPVEIIRRIKNREEISSFNLNLENSILNTIKRRPLTIDDLCSVSGRNRLELFKYIDVLEKEEKVFEKIVGDKIFYASMNKH